VVAGKPPHSAIQVRFLEPSKDRREAGEVHFAIMLMDTAAMFCNLDGTIPHDVLSPIHKPYSSHLSLGHITVSAMCIGIA
jgi:hypothetical protein